MAAQMRTLTPYVHQFLLAGSTGDGWDLDDQQFDELLSFAVHDAYWSAESRFLIGALGRSTHQVVRRGQAILDKLNQHALPGFVGIAVCPPVRSFASQSDIHDHYVEVVEAVGLPVAMYQLPQVTGCQIEPETFGRLLASHPSIYLLKDSSGDDLLARANTRPKDVVLVRGAENHYAESLKCGGGVYDGLLLSTANAFSYSLRSIVDTVKAGELVLARRRSSQLSAMVARLFEIAAACPSGNAYSNVSRAVDHVLAHGPYWCRVEPPMLFDGSRLPPNVLAEVTAIYNEEEGIPEHGYFLHRYIGLE
jgi:dihydrodipicolinate synthase/N-acetylneuraminate lyase